MGNGSELEKGRRKATKLGLNRAAQTLVLCMDKKTAKCCSHQSMRHAWNHLKRRTKQWRKEGNAPVLRLKTACIGICHAGPILGVLPDGVWYGHCDPDVIDRIFDEHLRDGKIVDEYVLGAAGGE